MILRSITRIAVLAAFLSTGLAIGYSQDQSTPSSAPQQVRVSSGVANRLKIKDSAPRYPMEARERGIQGSVIMQGVISKEGDVTDLKVLSGDPMLAEAAVKAVKKWNYRPYLLNGEPVEAETQFQVNFALSAG